MLDRGGDAGSKASPPVAAEAVMRELGLGQRLAPSMMNRRQTAASRAHARPGCRAGAPGAPRPLGEISVRCSSTHAMRKSERDGVLARCRRCFRRDRPAASSPQRRRVLGVSCALSEAEVDWRAVLDDQLDARLRQVSPISFPMIIQASCAPRDNATNSARYRRLAALSTIPLKTPFGAGNVALRKADRRAAPGLPNLRVETLIKHRG